MLSFCVIFCDVDSSSDCRLSSGRWLWGFEGSVRRLILVQFRNFLGITTTPAPRKRPLTTKTAPAHHHLFLYPFPIPLLLTGSGQLWAKHFPYLYPSTQILGITSTLYAYEDGTASKFRNVGTKSSDAGRLPKRHNTWLYYCFWTMVGLYYHFFFL